MKRLRIEIRLETPALLAASPPASNLTETLPFIPGNSVRGALARVYLETGKPEDEAFQELFVTGAARFGTAFPEGGIPIPLSARSCKYDPGFRGDGGHGVIDLLFEADREQRCAVCGAPLDYFEGYRSTQGAGKVEAATRLVTRTAIDPRRGTARTGMLYSQRVLEEDQTFVADLEIPGQFESILGELLRNSPRCFFGKGASRGQGWATMRRVSRKHWSPGPARDRFKSFSERFGEQVLAITLLSDAIFQDDALRNAASPSPDDLTLLGLKPTDWEETPFLSFARTRRVFGFDGAPTFLPREARTATCGGSVFVFRRKANSGGPVIPAGEGLGVVGSRHREGYGRALLWGPYHTEPDTGDTALDETTVGLSRDPDDSLILKARELYRFGFSPSHSGVTPAQMHAVGERIQFASAVESARKKVSEFLTRQRAKLEKRAERNGANPGSWLTKPSKQAEQDNLGDLLETWIEKGLYAPGQPADLGLLREFWRRFHGLYRYERALGQAMPLRIAEGED